MKTIKTVCYRPNLAKRASASFILSYGTVEDAEAALFKKRAQDAEDANKYGRKFKKMDFAIFVISTETNYTDDGYFISQTVTTHVLADKIFKNI